LKNISAAAITGASADPSIVPSNFPTRRLAWGLIALFLVAVGAKLWLIQGYASPSPYLDQWVEADRLFKPWVDGHLTWGDLLASHNGHRILFTRLLDLTGVELNGQWDPWLQMTVNALLHAGVICGLVHCLWRFEARKDQALLCWLLVPFLALPFAAENTLWGFQSQFYFLIGFAVIAMAGLGFHRPGSKGWLLGLAAAVFSLFTMGSGFLASLAVAGLLTLRWLKQGRMGDQAITAAACLAVAAVGAALAAHAGVEGVHSWGEILATLAWVLAWPFENKPVMLLFTCLPLALTLVKYLRGDFQDARAAEFLLAFGLWGFLQSAAVAYARATEVNCSRYTDLFCIIPIASLASLFILGGGKTFQHNSRAQLNVLAAGWIVILLGGLWKTSPGDWQNYDDADNYPVWSAQSKLMQTEKIHAFLAAGNSGPRPYRADLAGATNALLDPQLSRILPPVCRPALLVEKAPGSDDAFVLGGGPPGLPPREFSRAWGTGRTNGGAATARFISQPLTASLPMLDLEICCAPDADNISIELVEQASGRRIPVAPQVAGRWQVVTVPAPKSPFRLEITDHSATSSVAVAAVRESGRLAYFARGLIAHAVLILLAGLGLFAGLAAHDAIRRVTDLNSHAPIRWLVLLTTLAALAGVWSARDFNATNLTAGLYANCAKAYSRAGHPDEARRFLHEALWLRPDDEQLKAQLHALP
jgi:hypothetical protein